MTQCWVAVDKDGTEKISNSGFIRRRTVYSILLGLIPVCNVYSKNKNNKWANSWSTEEGNPLPFFGVELPKGTIEKLIGYKLTWADEPVEIK